ncbi:MAG: hypothetical protein DCC56_15915 [Anaerolineae bacterium]|nr:MAG: hypothetical protein DCC56_15915 [Anaerolineae bacterium]
MRKENQRVKSSTSALFAFLILGMYLLGGCTPAPSTLISTQTSTFVPTKTTLPTSTVTPTETPVPPAATVSAPDKSLEYLNGVEVVFLDTFDERLHRGLWHFGARVQVKNGAVEITGKDWNTIYPSQSYTERSGIVFDFSYTKGAIFETYISDGEWNTAGYKTFGIYFEKNLVRTNAWSGITSLGGEFIPGDLALKPDTDYSLLIAIIPDGEFLVVVWRPSDPSKTLYYREQIGKNWSNLFWNFGIAVDSGTFKLDNFRELKFDSAK